MQDSVVENDLTECGDSLDVNLDEKHFDEEVIETNTEIENNQDERESFIIVVSRKRKLCENENEPQDE